MTKTTDDDVRREVARMKLEGYRYRDICDELDIPPSAVGRHMRELKRLANEVLEDDARCIRLVEEDRLETLHRHWWPEALTGNEKAADIVLKTHAARARLWNLADVPAGDAAKTVKAKLLGLLMKDN